MRRFLFIVLVVAILGAVCIYFYKQKVKQIFPFSESSIVSAVVDSIPSSIPIKQAPLPPPPLTISVKKKDVYSMVSFTPPVIRFPDGSTDDASMEMVTKSDKISTLLRDTFGVMSVLLRAISLSKGIVVIQGVTERGVELFFINNVTNEVVQHTNSNEVEETMAPSLQRKHHVDENALDIVSVIKGEQLYPMELEPMIEALSIPYMNRLSTLVVLRGVEKTNKT